jgi:uncharacterized protein YraI
MDKNKKPVPLILFIIIVISILLFGCTIYSTVSKSATMKEIPTAVSSATIMVKNTEISATKIVLTVTPYPVCFVGNTDGDLLNFRMGAGREYPIMTGLVPGTQVVILEEVKGNQSELWFKVKIGNTTGYVFNQYCIK